jgi:hypothetical protein
MKYLDESKKHEALIELAQKNQDLFLSDTTIQMYLKGLRNKPIWNELVVKASKNNYRKIYS